MKLLERFPSLGTLPLFAVTDASHIERYLDPHFEIASFEAGETVYSSASERVRVGILLSGRAEIHANGAEAHALLKQATGGDLFGIANLYARDAAFPTVIQAKERTEVLFFEGDAFRDFIENDPRVLRVYLRMQSEKIIYLNRKIATFTAGSTEKRLALFLSEHQQNGVYNGSMTTLANLLGIGRASLYRALDKLSEWNLIEHHGTDIVIADASSLASFAYSS